MISFYLFVVRLLFILYSTYHIPLTTVCCFAVCCLLFASMALNNPHASAYVGIGSNLGDRAGNLVLAIRGMLDAGLEVNRLSQIYETEPVETFKQPTYLNMVAELRCGNLPRPEELMEQLLRVERSLGRTREVAMSPRTIDLDLLLYGNETVSTDSLTLPHPRLHRRRFVLVPLAELAPQLVHPILGKTVMQLLEALDDGSEVKHWIP